MKRNALIVGLILLIFFVISFLTNILGPIIPDLVDSFQLSIGLAGFLPFAFFVAGGEEHFAFNSVLAQLFSGAASFFSPLLYSYFVRTIHTDDTSFWIRLLNQVVPIHNEWVSLYWVFALTTLLMVGVVALVNFPAVALKDDEKIEVGGAFVELLRNKTVLLFFAGIFAYVGTEQGIANWLSKFLQLYHSVDPATAGATAVAYFWGLMTVGCVLGLILLKVADSRNVLMVFTIGAIVSLLLGLFGPKDWALYALPGTGFFASVMWSIVFSLALNSVPQHHGTFSGILCTGIVGGALVPLMIGGLAELTGLRLAMLLMLITLGYVFSIGVWAKPLVTNATINLKSEKVKECTRSFC